MKLCCLLQLRILKLDGSRGKLHVKTDRLQLQVSNVEKHRGTPCPIGQNPRQGAKA
jgi:hypothetical protein